MTASDDTPASLSTPDAAARPRAPRDSDDKPWEHPADGGNPLDGQAMWANDTAFGFFQTSEEYPDDLAQAMRGVFERMHRSGFRDWECESDYVEASYWFLRRNLEVCAREAFRLWYGDEQWREPFRAACRLQEEGAVEYRIDYLLRSECQAEIRKVPKEDTPPPEADRRGPRHGELAQDFLRLAPSILRPGEFVDCDEVAGRMRSHVEYRVQPSSLQYTLSKRDDLFERRLLPTQAGHMKAHFAPRAAPGGGDA